VKWRKHPDVERMKRQEGDGMQGVHREYKNVEQRRKGVAIEGD
jgi:hypothetical protein